MTGDPNDIAATLAMREERRTAHHWLVLWVSRGHDSKSRAILPTERCAEWAGASYTSVGLLGLDGRLVWPSPE